MKVTCVDYYCTYTRNTDDPPHYSALFPTEAQARGKPKLLAGAGYWGAIKKHRECKQDYENDYGWHLDREGAGDHPIAMEIFLTF